MHGQGNITNEKCDRLTQGVLAMASTTAPCDSARAGLATPTGSRFETSAVVRLLGVDNPPLWRTGDRHMGVSPARTRAVC